MDGEWEPDRVRLYDLCTWSIGSDGRTGVGRDLKCSSEGVKGGNRWCKWRIAKSAIVIIRNDVHYSLQILEIPRRI